MKKLLNMTRRFGKEEGGAAMVEYSILIGVITALTITAIVFVGGWVGDQWTELQTELTGEGAPPA